MQAVQAMEWLLRAGQLPLRISISSGSVQLLDVLL